MNWFVKFINQIMQRFRNFGAAASYSAGSSLDSVVNSVAEGINSYHNSGSPTFVGALTNLLNAWSGEHMTNAEVERNQMQMQNQEDIYQRQVTGMQNAGLNPALMYGSGAQSAPSVSTSQSPGMSMSDLMQAVLIDKQAKLLDSRVRNIDSDTDKKSAETERLKLINKYYPTVTQTTIDKMLSEIGFNDNRIRQISAEVDVLKLDADLKEIDKIIRKAEADEASAFYKARRELEEAKGDSEKASKRELVARAFMEEVEGKFMKDKGYKMGSAEVLAIASAFASLFGIDDTKGIGTDVFKAWRDSFGKPGGLLQKWIEDFIKGRNDGN